MSTGSVTEYKLVIITKYGRTGTQVHLQICNLDDRQTDTFRKYIPCESIISILEILVMAWLKQVCTSQE